MDNEKKKDILETSTGTIVDAIVDAASSTGADVVKELTSNLVGEFLVEVGASAIPGVGGAVSSYKRVRFEKNIKKLVEGLANRIEELKSSLEDKSETQQHKINTLFTYVLDYVIDEKQELKIDIMVNGFINISHHEDISEDFVLTYYDVLRDLRLIDISVLRFYSKLKNYDQEGQITIIDILEEYEVSYEQYESVRHNLLRFGLLTTKKDYKVIDDIEELSQSISNIHKYFKAIKEGKKRLPTLKDPKIKSTDKFELSKFGKDFVWFFLNDATRL
ncbi:MULTISPECIES: hypothetical protein [Bacillus amyloliquefaciens group]|uniref:hypothetical protein n=1 Tax=Bacillus amyloliquefaciens group TaxID=1938374 RepID=UPI0007F8744F|nr:MULTISPECIES: hypothetical protein [Bacillus amyloliquefaciens group]AVB08460.1 hypothetical protein C3438_02160 [Bacillus velezensis]MBO3651099.1 hypothetical protein [Bacillus amyloliquefaciens]MBW7977548.1 hypothetical protein [Bacillus velezensis]MCJ2173506.1 hypothetical protein [Bacillus amyloliquefaciens]MCR4350449.1 hypothetical protein [Bacillus amyloliquefaciens]